MSVPSPSSLRRTLQISTTSVLPHPHFQFRTERPEAEWSEIELRLGVEFPPDELPALYNAIEIPQDGNKIVLETQEHAGNNWVRCLSLSPTDGLERGAEATDTGAPLTVPVGEASLGRLFNVLGEALDNLGPVKAEDRLIFPLPLIHTLP